MCGIVGYVGHRPVQDLLLSGLEKLEYRGYDSAGLSLVSDGSIGSIHAVGNLQNLRDALASSNGHLIDMGFVPSGDGIAAALLTLEALGDADLADRRAMRKLPQTLVNVRIAERGALEGAAGVEEAVGREQAALEGRGRVLVRPSGTEPLVRVMVEAPTAEEAEAVCGRLVAVVEAETA